MSRPLWSTTTRETRIIRQCDPEMIAFRAYVSNVRATMLVPQFLNPVWRTWQAIEFVSGRLPVSGIQADWIQPSLGNIDPAREAESVRTRLELGITSRRAEILASAAILPWSQRRSRPNRLSLQGHPHRGVLPMPSPWPKSVIVESGVPVDIFAADGVEATENNLTIQNIGSRSIMTGFRAAAPVASDAGFRVAPRETAILTRPPIAGDIQWLWVNSGSARLLYEPAHVPNFT